MLISYTRAAPHASCWGAATADLKTNKSQPREDQKGRQTALLVLIYTALSFISFPLLPKHTSCSPTVLLPGKSMCLPSAIMNLQFLSSLTLEFFLILLEYSPFGTLQTCWGKEPIWTCSQEHTNKSLALGTQNLQYFAQKQSEIADTQCLPLHSKQRRCSGWHCFSSSPQRTRGSCQQDSYPASTDLLPLWKNLLLKTLSSLTACWTTKGGSSLV